MFPKIKKLEKNDFPIHFTEENYVELISAAFENLDEGLVITDHETRIITMNKMYREFLNVELDDIIGKPVKDVIDNTRLHIVKETEVPEIGQVQKINGKNAITSRIPLFKEDGTLYALAGRVMFQDIKDLESLSQNINRLQSEVEYYKRELEKSTGVKYSFDHIKGSSEKIIELKRFAEKVAKSNSTVLITGESGTGKELLAHAIHRTSHRKHEKFVKINCAAIPESLFESELFGYAEGAFTGGLKGGKKGKIELADKGTLFLDEVGEMPLQMQVKILRTLQEKEIEKVGDGSSKKVDVRIIAATNKDLLKLVDEGEFRLDLYYRLNVMSLELPALRERVEDIPILAKEILNDLYSETRIEVKEIVPEAMQKLMSYHWPGNIRELKNILERSLFMIKDNRILPSDLSISNTTAEENHDLNLKNIINETEKKVIEKVLQICDYDRNESIKMLGISRSSFYQKLQKYEIEF
jgi:transcriptional regulator with PAS, ATPase and Fis domain